MNVLQSFRFAAGGLAANKLRSMLTTLGLLIGVAAVIILVAVGTGSGAAVQKQISSLGSRTLTVTSTSGGTGGRRGTGGGGFGGFGSGGGAGGTTGSVSTGTQTRTSALTVADAEALQDRTTLPDVEAVAPTVSASSVVATYDGATDTITTVTGTTPSYLSIESDTVEAGALFTDADYLAKRRVVLIGVTVAQELVGGTGTAAVGKVIQLDGAEFTVLGVLTSKGSTGITDNDNVAIAPLPAVQDRLAGYGSLSSIAVEATSSATTTAADAEVTAALDLAHKVTSTTADFTVTERTREIGIRKAIGAQRGAIVSQFLFEAVLLSILGGLAGVAVGLIGSQFTIAGIQPVVAPYSVGLAFGVSVVIGLFFGLYPANRASLLRPIDALRYE